MSKILRLSKRLTAPHQPALPPSTAIRTFIGPGDIDAWLRLHRAALSGLTAAGPTWTAVRFEREFLAKPDWSPEHLWFAVRECPASVGDESAVARPLGTIALGRGGRPPHEAAMVRWLMVAPEARRRGIGAALLACAELRAWEDGARVVALETHVDWSDAVRLYRRAGYDLDRRA